MSAGSGASANDGVPPTGKPPLRVLHVLNDIEDLGNGINNSTIDLACEQRAMGLDVHVASGGGDHLALLQRRGVVHHELRQSLRPAQLLAARLRLRSLVRRIRPDVVHVHNLTGALLTAASGRRRWAVVATLHLEAKPGVRVMGTADRVIALNSCAALRHPLLPRDVVLDVVPQGNVGGARAAETAGGPQPVQHPAVLTVCGLYEHKGVYTLLEAFAQVLEKVPDAHLYYVGGGPDGDELRRRRDATPYADRVHVEGFASRTAPWLQAADVFVLASLREPAGLVLAEARAAGKAIVATRTGGIPTLVEDGVSGLLVEPGDPDALAQRVVDVLSDDGLRSRLEHSAAQDLEPLSSRRFARDVLGVYEAALATRRR